MSGGGWRLVRSEIQRPFHKNQKFPKKFIFWGPGAEFPYLGIIAKIQFPCIPWMATALSNSTFINYVNITFPCWNGLIWWRQNDLWCHWFFHTAVSPSVFGDIVLEVIDSVVHSIVFFGRYFNASYITCLLNFQLDYSEVWTTVQIWLSFDFIQELMNYARKLDIGLLCPNMEIRPRAPKNGIFHFYGKVSRFRF